MRDGSTSQAGAIDPLEAQALDLEVCAEGAAVVPVVGAVVPVFWQKPVKSVQHRPCSTQSQKVGRLLGGSWPVVPPGWWLGGCSGPSGLGKPSTCS